LAVVGAMRPLDPAAPRCDGGAGHLARVWNPGVALAVRGALLGTGRRDAEDTADRVALALDRYAASWSAMHRDACEASLVRHEQSPALLDLRMTCLDRRLGSLGALALALARRPDPAVLDRATRAALSLEPLDRCADAAALAAPVAPPTDPAVRARVAALRPRLEKVETLYRTGQLQGSLDIARALVADARAAGHEAVLAEALHDTELLANEAADGELAEASLREGLQVAARVHDDLLLAAMWGDLIKVVGSTRGKLAEALALVPAAEAALSRAGDPPREHARLLVNLGVVYDEAGRYKEAAQALRGSIPLIEATGDDNALQKALNDLGMTLNDLGEYDEARRFLERARGLADKLFGADSPITATTIANLGTVAFQEGRLAEAAGLWGQALDEWSRTLGPDNLKCARMHNNLANVYISEGRVDDAVVSMERAVAIKAKALGPEASPTVRSMGDLASFYLQAGRIADARPLAQRVLALDEKALGSESLLVSETLSTLAEIELADGRLAAARAAATRSLAIAEKALGPDSVEATAARVDLADVAQAEGRYAEALAGHQRALAVREKTAGPEHPMAAAEHARIGQALLSLGRSAEAIVELERALAIFGKVEGAPHDLAVTRLFMARALQRRDPPRARALAESARAELAREGPRVAKERAEAERLAR
jgi:tetratricopeptide (TPR) repeat protein